MTLSELRAFLTDTMSMSEVYQPVIIKELLENGGTCSKEHLAARLADHDEAVQDYYRKVLMRYPKQTLTSHGVVEYDRRSRTFSLNVDESVRNARGLIRICEDKIDDWLERRSSRSNNVSSSRRYQVLKASGGKCELCGIPSSLRPIDVDHIVPQSKANRYGKVIIGGRPVDVHSMENLQALCMTCNRGKSAGDNTDWRVRRKLVRDRIPALMVAEGKSPYVVQLTGRKLRKALREKLIEEVEEYLDSGDVEELADVAEVLIALAESHGLTAAELEALRTRKRKERGGFEDGLYYSGDKPSGA